MNKLPDGSGFFVESLPLPKDPLEKAKPVVRNGDMFHLLSKAHVDGDCEICRKTLSNRV